ncbi:methionyl-tRNA formyltransferase [soil metagenome]
MGALVVADKLRVALFGSPGFALPVLKMLYEHGQVVLVVTQPDKPVGRGLELRSPPLAAAAKESGLRLEQPARLKKNDAFHELVESLNLDVAITTAYGKILPQSLLDLPEHGFLNVHASLLPKYRGAAQIQWALINGETETGVSIMQTEAGLDTGPVRHMARLAIAPEDTALTLFDKLANLGAAALAEGLELLAACRLPCQPQDATEATVAPLLTKEDGEVRWTDTAEAVVNRYRGVIAWPGTWTRFGERVLKIHNLSVAEGGGAPGTVLKVAKEGVTVATGGGAVILTSVQPPNKAKMPAYDWANGYHVKEGDKLG